MPAIANDERKAYCNLSEPQVGCWRDGRPRAGRLALHHSDIKWNVARNRFSKLRPIICLWAVSSLVNKEAIEVPSNVRSC